MKNSILTILQILLFIYIVFVSGPFFVFSVPFVLIQIVGALLIIWAILVKRINKRKPGFSSRKDASLIEDGPYEFVRHPIDTGLLLIVSTYAQDYVTTQRMVGILIFLLILLIRINDDEKKSSDYFKKEYTDYKKKTKRLIPYVY